MIGRRVPRLAAVAALVGVLLAGLLPGAVLAAAPDPRVVFVVGPVGGLTESYRSLARAGAVEARRWTDDVVEVYSPNATWPKVRAALQGASVVVYLGHGNGFPSPYGNELRRAVQDGFGLNPVAGRGDAAHQYFGEAPIAEQVRLAPGAVVLLFHLCYASGNSEPGVPEGAETVARQRVDNFAAGFLAAGASAVVADAFASPASYVRSLLGSKVSARAAWNRSSTAHDNVRAFASARTPGAVALMDPERASSGFTRSLVLATGASGLVPAGPVRGTETPPGGWEVVAPPDPTADPGRLRPRRAPGPADPGRAGRGRDDRRPRPAGRGPGRREARRRVPHRDALDAARRPRRGRRTRPSGGGDVPAVGVGRERSRSSPPRPPPPGSTSPTRRRPERRSRRRCRSRPRAAGTASRSRSTTPTGSPSRTTSRRRSRPSSSTSAAPERRGSTRRPP